MKMYDLTLSEEQLYQVTGTRQPTRQLKRLQELGIPAKRRTDNTVAVLLVHCTHPVQLPESTKPQLKSSRR